MRPSLLIIPANETPGVLMPQIPFNGTADFTVSRTTTPANNSTRVNSSGLIEIVNDNVPRIDYLNQSCPALLVEASGQNLVLNSEDTATNWTIGANTASGYVDVIGVSGNTITASASGSIGTNVFVRRTLNTVLASGSTYTVSFLMRQTGAHTIGGYWIGIVGVGDVGAGFDVSGSFSNGAIYSAAGVTNRIRRVERWGTDVYRCSETFTMTASGTLDRMIMGPVAAVNSTALVASGTQMSFAAPQIELSAFPTSFIPTTTAAVSRAADVISASGALVSGLIGQTEGTIYAEFVTRVTAGTAAKRVLTISNGDDGNRISIGKAADDSLIGLILTGGVTQALISTAANQSGTFKMALAFQANDAVLYINGVQIGTDNSLTMPTGFNRIDLGQNAGNASQFNDRIRAAAIYTSRLSNDNLMLLTLPTNDGYLPTSIWNYYLSKPGVSEVSDCLYERYFNILNI
jgi:hypothetical protein